MFVDPFHLWGPAGCPVQGSAPGESVLFWGKVYFGEKVPSLSLPVTGETTPISLPLSASDGSSEDALEGLRVT